MDRTSFASPPMPRTPGSVTKAVRLLKVLPSCWAQGVAPSEFGNDQPHIDFSVAFQWFSHFQDRRGHCCTAAPPCVGVHAKASLFNFYPSSKVAYFSRTNVMPPAVSSLSETSNMDWLSAVFRRRNILQHTTRRLLAATRRCIVMDDTRPPSAQRWAGRTTELAGGMQNS